MADLATNGFLNTTYIDLQAFTRYNKKNDTIETWNCYEILRELMHSTGCTMYQSDNKWYITRIEEGENASVNFLEYTVNSSTYAATLDSSGTVTIQTPITNTEAGITWLLQDANMEISEVFNELILDYQYNLGEVSNTDIIVDGDFTFFANDFTIEQRMGLFEIGSGLATISTNLNDLITKGTTPAPHLGFKETLLQYNSGAFNLNNYLLPLDGVPPYSTKTRRNWITTTSDTSVINISVSQLKVLFTYFESELYAFGGLPKYIPPGFWNYQYQVNHYFSIQVGSYYLQEDSSGALSWGTTSSSRIERIFTVLLGEYDNSWESAQIWGDIFFPLTPGGPSVTIPTIHKNIILDFNNPHDIEIELPEFPETGVVDLIIKAYTPTTPSLLYSTIYPDFTQWVIEHEILPKNIFYDSWSWQYLPDSNRISNQTKTISTVTSGVRKKTKEIKTLFGDGPAAFIRNSFLLKPGSDYEVAITWNNRGTPTPSFNVTSVTDNGGYAQYNSTTDTHSFTTNDIARGTGFGTATGYNTLQKITATPTSSSFVTDALFTTDSTGTIYAFTGSSVKFLLDPYTKYFTEYRRQISGTLYGDFQFHNTILSTDSKVYFIDRCSFNVIKNQFNLELLQLTGSNTGVIDINSEAIPFPQDTFPTPNAPSPDTPSDIIQQRMISTTSSNAQNFNMQNKSGQITQVNDEITNSTNYTKYP